MLRPLLALALLLSASACTTTETVVSRTELPLQTNEAFAAMVVVGEPGFALVPGATWRLREETSGVEVQAKQLLQPQVEEAISQALAGVGLAAASNGEQAAIEVAYALSSEQFASDELLRKRYGLTPGVMKPDERWAKGTLVLVLVDPATHRPVWRAATQGLLHEGADAALVREQIRQTTARMARAIPIHADAVREQSAE
jgi:hypothetical protein